MKKPLYAIHDTIIREYDIRGPVHENAINTTQAYCIGLRFGSFLYSQGMTSCAVGYDGRLSSPSLHASLIEGLQKTGTHVFDIGLGPSPQLYFAVQYLNCDAGVMVTGSHNPPQDNGFKINLKTRPFFGTDLRELQIVDLHLPQKFGPLKTKIVIGAYCDRLIRDYTPQNQPLKIVCDAGNGAAGPVLAFMKDRLHADIHLINNDVDGNFPNHHPDPSIPANMSQLKEAVLKYNADVGFAFDGDADRLGVIDNIGTILNSDTILTLLARDVLGQNPSAHIVADVKTSQAFFDDLSSKGANVHVCRTGHSLIKEKMQETGALFAGEMSGHIFFKDTYYGFDDALYAMIRFLNILHKSESPLSDLTNDIPRLFNTPMLKIPCADDQKFSIITALQKSMREQNKRIDTIDGVRAVNNKGWWLIRASNTEPALVARCEAYQQEDLSDLVEEVKCALESVGLELNI